MRVFLTGATGAIGPGTVRGLLEKGHQVRAVTRTDDKAAKLRARRVPSPSRSTCSTATR